MKNLKNLLRAGALVLAISSAAVALSGTYHASAQVPDCDEDGSYCLRTGSGGGNTNVVRVWLDPQSDTYFVGDVVDLCARAERSGTLTFTNRRNGRVRDLPITMSVSAGRTYCINGQIEDGDECVGARLTSGGARFSAREFCFNAF